MRGLPGPAGDGMDAVDHHVQVRMFRIAMTDDQGLVFNEAHEVERLSGDAFHFLRRRRFVGMPGDHRVIQRLLCAAREFGGGGHDFCGNQRVSRGQVARGEPGDAAVALCVVDEVAGEIGETGVRRGDLRQHALQVGDFCIQHRKRLAQIVSQRGLPAPVGDMGKLVEIVADAAEFADRGRLEVARRQSGALAREMRHDQRPHQFGERHGAVGRFGREVVKFSRTEAGVKLAGQRHLGIRLALAISAWWHGGGSSRRVRASVRGRQQPLARPFWAFCPERHTSPVC